MNKIHMQLALAIGGAALLTGTVGFSLTQNNNNELSLIHASNTYSIVLSAANAPVLQEGRGEIVDNKGVTWEYSNALSYNGGHVTLDNDGYCGVSVDTEWGITAIGDIVVNFTADEPELWLLKSTDGIEWHECLELQSGISTSAANNWRYIRFYNAGEELVNIYSISVGYNCIGSTSTEDVDSARVENVIATKNATAAKETETLSPRSNGGEAIRFTKISGTTTLTIGFGKTYTIGEIQNSKVEFDLKGNVNYGKTLTLMHNTTSVSSAINSTKGNSYKCTNILEDWYHIEVPITALISTISGYNGKDIPASNILTKEVNAIQINAGSCVIDNLKIGSSECELGIFNNPDYKPAKGEIFWLKVSWVGKLHSCTMSFSDDSLARQIPTTDPLLKHASPFYMELLNSGTLTVTATVVSGYNYRVQVIEHTITIK